MTTELQRAAAVLFVTGAGISHASGIPTFRGPDPDAIWSHDVLEMATLAFFRSNPVEQWQWYLQRFDSCRGAQPNPAHHAITQIEELVTASGRVFHLITQNIDGLHAAAETRNLIEIHGAARKVRCARQGCPNGAPHGSMPWNEQWLTSFRHKPTLDALPRCPICSGLLRPHVLWFDEFYNDHDDYAFEAAQNAVQRATVVVFVGTSFSVGITAAVLDAVQRRRLPCWAIDPHLPAAPISSMHVVREPAEDFLPRTVAELKLSSLS